MIKTQSNLGTKEDQISKDILDFQVLQSENWEKTKLLISKSIREIFWKAWIEPLTFIKFENKILNAKIFELKENILNPSLKDQKSNRYRS